MYVSACKCDSVGFKKNPAVQATTVPSRLTSLAGYYFTSSSARPLSVAVQEWSGATCSVVALPKSHSLMEPPVVSRRFSTYIVRPIQLIHIYSHNTKLTAPYHKSSMTIITTLANASLASEASSLIFHAYSENMYYGMWSARLEKPRIQTTTTKLRSPINCCCTIQRCNIILHMSVLYYGERVTLRSLCIMGGVCE